MLSYLVFQFAIDLALLVMTHFKGRVYCWDVVNEVVDENHTFSNLSEHACLASERQRDPCFVPFL